MLKSFRILFLFCLGLVFSCADPVVVPVNIDPSLIPNLTGVNVAGGDIYYKNLPANGVLTSGSQFLFITHKDVDYLASKNMNFIRLLFSWEAMQPTLNGAIDNKGTYGLAMKDVVDYATSKNLFVMIEPHAGLSDAFAGYRGNKVGSTAVPSASFGDFWKKMADIYKGNPRVLYGLSNEPNGMGTMQWYGAAQSAITGIRNSGSSQTIMVPGNGFSAPSSWNDNWYDTATPKVSNAVGWLTLKDPKNNLVATTHVYADSGGGGGADDIVSATIYQERIAPIVAWAKTNKIKVHLSEYGVNTTNTLAQSTLTNLMNYLKSNSDVMIGSAFWTYGSLSWWSSYRFTMCPKNNYTTDDPKMTWVSPFFTPATSAVPTVKPVPTVVPTPTVIPPTVCAITQDAPPSWETGRVGFFTRTNGTVSYSGFKPSSYTGTTPVMLLVGLHGCGDTAQNFSWWGINPAETNQTQNYIGISVGGRDGGCWDTTADQSMVLAAINDAKQCFNIDPRKVVLGGYSSGGEMTYKLGLSQASQFAGLLIEDASLSGADPKAASWKINIAHITHTSDTVFPLATVQADWSKIQTAGLLLQTSQVAGDHSGTTTDWGTYLLPKIATWQSPAPVVDAGPVIVDSGIPDVSVPDTSIPPVVDAGPSVLTLYARAQVYNSGTTGGANGVGWVCQYYFIKNTTKSNINWSLMYINTQGAALTSFWSMKTNQKLGDVGSVKFSPLDVPVATALTEVKVGGACFDLAATKKVPTVSGIN